MQWVALVCPHGFSSVFWLAQFSGSGLVGLMSLFVGLMGCLVIWLVGLTHICVMLYFQVKIPSKDDKPGGSPGKQGPKEVRAYVLCLMMQSVVEMLIETLLCLCAVQKHLSSPMVLPTIHELDTFKYVCGCLVLSVAWIIKPKLLI